MPLSQRPPWAVPVRGFRCPLSRRSSSARRAWPRAVSQAPPGGTSTGEGFLQTPGQAKRATKTGGAVQMLPRYPDGAGMMTPVGIIIQYSSCTSCSQASEGAQRTPWLFSSTAKRSGALGKASLSPGTRGERKPSRVEYCIATATRKVRVTFDYSAWNSKSNFATNCTETLKWQNNKPGGQRKRMW